MSTLVEDETDDEYLDDPIKLFDFEQERVHFGTHSYEKGYASNTFCQTSKNVTSPDDAVTTIDDFNESDCLPLCVKLVDCAKFPWYFKKYTQQILSNTDICDLFSDSDNEVDLEYVSDNNNDCCIIEDGIKTNDFEITNNDIEKTAQKVLPKVMCKTTMERRQESMKRREDAEIQKALSQKNMFEIDFKRNRGLVGMRITPKLMTNVGPDLTSTGQNNDSFTETTYKKSYISAADKILSDIGTDLIPITETESTQNSNSIEKHTKCDLGKTKKNKSAAYSQSKMFKQLFYRMKTKQISARSDTAKEKRNEMKNRLKFVPDLTSDSTANGKPSHHVKNIKKTNKYKNSQVKAIKKMVSELFPSALDKEKIHEGCKETQKEYISKTAECNKEPKSPILPCSTLVKKQRNFSEPKPHIEGINQNITNKTDNFNITNKPVAMKGNSNNNEHIDKTPGKNVVEKITNHDKKKNEHVNEGGANYKATPTESHMNPKEVIDIGMTNVERFSGMSKINEPTYNMQFSMSECINKAIDNLTPASKPDSHVLPKQSKTDNVTITAIEQVSPVSNISANDLSKLKEFVNGVKSNLSSQNSSSNYNPDNCSTTHNNNNSTSLPIPYASGTAVQSNQPSDATRVRFHESFLNAQQPMIPMQSRFYQNPYPAHYNSYPHHGRNTNFTPRSANCAFPNYRFPPPRDNVCPSQYNSTHYQSMNVGVQQPYPLPKNFSKRTWAPNDLPCRYPVSIPYKLPRPKNNFQSNNIPHPNNILHKVDSVIKSTPRSILDNVSQPNNPTMANIYSNYNPDKIDSVIKRHNNLEKTKNSKLMSLLEDNSSVINNKSLESKNINTEVVTSKTKMLEVLDNASANLKRKGIENDDRAVQQEVVNAFKRPKTSDKVQTVQTEENNHIQANHPNGYSPPILPIPTYTKAINQVISVLQTSDGQNNRPAPERQGNNKSRKKHVEKCCEQVLNKTHGHKDQAKKDGFKKISLEEYKKRTLKMNRKSEDSKKATTSDKYRKHPNILKFRDSVDRFSTESDLGYDSDSTVIL